MGNLIVAFHVGRGGRFYNGGHVSFIGEKNMHQLINMNDNHVFYEDRVNGKFSKPYYTDSNGNIIVDTDDYSKEVGRLDFDGIYDTYYCKYIEDCTDSELELINDSDRYKSVQLEDYLSTLELS